MTSIFHLSPGSDEFRQALEKYKADREGYVRVDPAGALWLDAYEKDDSDYKEAATEWERHRDDHLVRGPKPEAWAGLHFGPRVTLTTGTGPTEMVYDPIDRCWFSDHHEFSYDEGKQRWTLNAMVGGGQEVATGSGEKTDGSVFVKFGDAVVEGGLWDIPWEDDGGDVMLTAQGYGPCGEINDTVSPGALYCVDQRTATTLVIGYYYGTMTYCDETGEEPVIAVADVDGVIQISVDGTVWYTPDFDYIIPPDPYGYDRVAILYGLDPGTCYYIRIKYNSSGGGPVYSNEETCCTAPPNTYDELMVGGVVGGGEAQVQLVVTVQTSGGVRAGGESIVESGFYGSGGVRAAGSATVLYVAKPTTSGGGVVAGPKFPGNKTHRLVVTVDADMVPSDLDDFPFEVAAVVGRDMAISGVIATTTAGVVLPSELISYESDSGRLAIAVRTDLSGTVDTVFWVYFGD